MTRDALRRKLFQKSKEECKNRSLFQFHFSDLCCMFTKAVQALLHFYRCCSVTFVLLGGATLHNSKRGPCVEPWIAFIEPLVCAEKKD